MFCKCCTLLDVWLIQLQLAYAAQLTIPYSVVLVVAKLRSA